MIFELLGPNGAGAYNGKRGERGLHVYLLGFDNNFVSPLRKTTL